MEETPRLRDTLPLRYRAALFIVLLCPKLGRAMPRAGVVKLRAEKLPPLMLRDVMLFRALPMLRDMLAPLPRDIPPRDMPPNEPPFPAFADTEMPRITAVAAVIIRSRFIDRCISTPDFFVFVSPLAGRSPASSLAKRDLQRVVTALATFLA